MFLILLQIDHIFLSRVCSETAGGLPGLFLERSAKMLQLQLKIVYCIFVLSPVKCVVTLYVEIFKHSIVLSISALVMKKRLFLLTLNCPTFTLHHRFAVDFGWHG